MTPELQSEKWKPVVGYENLYEISNMGRVRALFNGARNRHKAGRILKPKTTTTGYLIIALFGKKKICYRTIHKMVLESFVCLRPDGKEARHLDDVKSNNVLTNLKWGTRKQNIQDKRSNGKIPCGENHIRSKLKNTDVLKIRQLWKNGWTVKQIAKEFHVCQMAAWRAATSKTWKHL